MKKVHRARSMALSCGYFFLLHALKGERSLFASNCRHIVDFLDAYCTDTSGIIGNGVFLLGQKTKLRVVPEKLGNKNTS